MADVRKLREAVEIANEAAAKLEARKLYPDHAPNIGRAFNGSLDAAKALHDTLLPDAEWYPCIRPRGPHYGFMYATDDGEESIRSEAENPARAHLLAILRALEGGAE